MWSWHSCDDGPKISQNIPKKNIACYGNFLKIETFCPIFNFSGGSALVSGLGGTGGESAFGGTVGLLPLQTSQSTRLVCQHPPPSSSLASILHNNQKQEIVPKIARFSQFKILGGAHYPLMPWNGQGTIAIPMITMFSALCILAHPPIPTPFICFSQLPLIMISIWAPSTWTTGFWEIVLFTEYLQRHLNWGS